MNRRQFVASLAAAGASISAAAAHTREASRVNASSGTQRGERPICVFSKHLQFLDYDEMAETAAEIGFDGVDLTVRPGGHVLPEHAARDLPRAVAAVRAAGLEAPMMTTAIAYVDDPHAETVLRTAADEGIKYYRMNWVAYENEAGVTETLQAYRPHLEKLVEINERLGLHGAYQNHAGQWVGAPLWDLHRLLEGLDPEHVGSQFDIRHATVEGANTWPLGLKLLAPHVRTTVVKDFEWEERDGDWFVKNVPLGEGMVDFDAYFDLVRRLEIAGPISLHFEYEMPEQGPLEQRARETAARMRTDLNRLRSYLRDAQL